MYTFIGDYPGKADQKNRIVVPAVFKRSLDDGGCTTVVVKKDLFAECLSLFPSDVWAAMMADLRERVNPYDRRQAQFMREFLRNTAEVTLDGNGRILVAQRFLDMIGAGRELTFVGVDDHMELWDSTKYSQPSLTPDELGNLAESIFGGKEVRQ